MSKCLTCKYEPEWGKEFRMEYKRRIGYCKWSGKIPKLPAIYRISKEGITRYSDNSGLPTKCETWEAK